MPWMETGTMDLRHRFISNWMRKDVPFTRDDRKRKGPYQTPRSVEI
jgi:hypothetical protein